MDSVLGFLAFLVTGVFLFSFAGVIALLVKTSRQEKNIQELRNRINRLLAAKAEKTTEAGKPAEAEKPQAVPVQPVYAEEAAVPLAKKANVPPKASFAEARPPEPEKQNRLREAVLSFIRRGNLWAAGGVILLIAGFSFLIAYLARRGFFTVEMGISAAAAAGLVMVLAGWRFRRKRPKFFRILQGGGLGLLYLAVYAAHKLTPHLAIVPALILLSLLIPPAVIMALFQNSQGLAMLGFLGGFAGPVLLSSGGDHHVFLFSYYTVLNCGVIAISFFGPAAGKRPDCKSEDCKSEDCKSEDCKSAEWKGLNLLAFFFTFIPSLYWAMTRYKPEYLPSSEPFFIVFIFLFTLLGIRGLLHTGQLDAGGMEKPRPPLYYRYLRYSDLILILGAPAAAAALQWKVFSFVKHGYAIIALAFSAYYLLLTVVTLKKFPVLRSYSEAYLALGILLANVAIPLELSSGVNGALWAAEGAVIFFIGFRMPAVKGRTGKGDIRLIIAGVLVHAAAAIVFIREIILAWYKTEPAPWRSPAFTGAVIIALSALVMAAITEKLSPKKPGQGQNQWALSAAIWGFAWWFGGWYFEFRRVLQTPQDAFLIFASLSALLCWLGAAIFRLNFLLAALIPASLTAAITVIRIFYENFDRYFPFKNELIFTYNFFSPAAFRGWLAFLLSQTLMAVLPRGVKKISGAEPVWFRDTRIFILVLTALALFSGSGRFYTMKFGLGPSWTSLAALVPLFAALLILPFSGLNRDTTMRWKRLLGLVLPVLLSGILGLWFIITLFLPGDPAPLPLYIPVINPLDLLEGLCIASILFWQITMAGKDTPEQQKKKRRAASIVLGDIMVFLWIPSILARSIHYYAGVPWNRVPGSDTFQLCLFIYWALYGILHIVLGHKLKMRSLWIAGAILVVVDIAKLILLDMRNIDTVPRILSFFAAGIVLLFIGWAAPLPPQGLEKKK